MPSKAEAKLPATAQAGLQAASGSPLQQLCIHHVVSVENDPKPSGMGETEQTPLAFNARMQQQQQQDRLHVGHSSTATAQAAVPCRSSWSRCCWRHKGCRRVTPLAARARQAAGAAGSPPWSLTQQRGKLPPGYHDDSSPVSNDTHKGLVLPGLTNVNMVRGPVRHLPAPKLTVCSTPFPLPCRQT